MFNYIGQIIIFLAAFVAIKGGTWNKAKKGIKKLTVTGLITLILAVLGLAVSLVITYQSERQIKNDSQKLAEAEKNTKQLIQDADTAKEQRDKFNNKLSVAKSTMEYLRKQNENMQKQNEELGRQSSLQSQEVFSRYIELNPDRRYIIIPRSCYGGEMIKFHFEKQILLVYAYERDISGGLFGVLLDNIIKLRKMDLRLQYRRGINDEQSLSFLFETLRNFQSRRRLSPGNYISYHGEKLKWKFMKTVDGREVPIEGWEREPCIVGIVNFSRGACRGKVRITSIPIYRPPDD
jgi:hypothetical protein